MGIRYNMLVNAPSSEGNIAGSDAPGAWLTQDLPRWSIFEALRADNTSLGQFIFGCLILVLTHQQEACAFG